MDKDEALWVESKLGSDPNGELKSISLINKTHPSLEVLDKINLRSTNPWKILDNKTSNECHRHGMMATMFLPIDIHEETPLEPEKEDDICNTPSVTSLLSTEIEAQEGLAKQVFRF